jgi:hypothetical protein
MILSLLRRGFFRLPACESRPFWRGLMGVSVIWFHVSQHRVYQEEGQ